MLNNSPLTAEVVSTLDFCRNLPDRPAKSVPRDHLLEEVRRTLEGKADIVLVIGEALTGKSELLAELFRRNSDGCIGIFLGPDSYFRSKDYIRLVVAEQISWLVDRVALREDAVSEESYQRMLYKLQKHARHRKVIWLVDGIVLGRSGEAHELKELFDLLPCGTREFNFVITSESDITPYLTSSNRSTKIMEVMLVSPDEARGFLGDLVKNEKDIQEIRSFCHSSIGRMQKVRSLLSEGLKISELLESRNESLEALLELEWSHIPASTEMKNVMAVVAFSDNPISLHEIAAQTDLDEHYVKSLIGESRILSCSSEEQNSIVSIDSRAQRVFVMHKLAHLENHVRSKAIDRLLLAPEAKEATRYLPAQLAKAGRNADLIQRLNPQHFVRLLETERTLRALRQHAEFGREAAQQLGDFCNEMAFSLISSMNTGLKLSVGTTAQIAALTKLGDTEVALELAAIAPTTEERLHLLARAVNVFGSNGHGISEDIRDELKQLVKDVDSASLGDLGVDIACDLLVVDVKLATDLINRVVDGAKRWFENSAANQESVGGRFEDGEAVVPEEESLPNNKGAEIAEHKLQRFFIEVGRRIERYKAENLLKWLKDEDPEFALFVCKRWLQRNKGDDEAHQIAHAALDFMLDNVSRSPQIKDLREIAEVLPSIKDSAAMRQLCDRIDTQYRILGHHGTSVESVRLRLQLYGAKYTGEQSDIELDLIDMFIEIQGLPDIATRATCWAWMLRHLCSFPKRDSLEQTTDLVSLVSNELEKTINELLMSSADHFRASKEAIAAIAEMDANKAFELVGRLNTISARNKGYQALVINLLPLHYGAAQVITKAISAITEDLTRSEMAVETLLILRDRGLTTDTKQLNDGILSLWKPIELSTYKFQAAVIAMTYHVEAERHETVQDLNNVIFAIWDSVQTEAEKIELGYWAASKLAEVNKNMARDWIKQSQDLARRSKASSSMLIHALYYAVRLCIRLLPTVYIPNALDGESKDLKRLSFLVSNIPHPEMQLRLWCNMSIRLHFGGHIGIAKELIQQHIVSILDRDYTNNEYLKSAFIIEAAPALYLAHQSSAVHRIDGMRSALNRDRARRNIITVLLQRTPLWEPYRSVREPEYELDCNTVTDLLNLLKGCKSDVIIYGIVHDLCRSLVSDRNKRTLQRNAVVDYLRSIEETVATLLPDKENIKHEGYLIACNASIQSARSEIQKDSATQATPMWEALYNKARAIDNVADRAVVTAIVGVNSHTRPESPVTAWFQNVQTDLSIIPSAFDKLDRYEWIARIIEPSDKAAARTLLAESLNLSSYLPSNDDLIKQQRRILDFAHVIDPNLANDLVEKLDTDEARKAHLKKRLAINSNRKNLATKPDSVNLKDLDDEQLSSICLDNLGLLVAGRINARPMEEFKELIRRARVIAFRDSFPIWEWIVENSVRKLGPNKQGANETCVKLFDATLRASEIALGLMERLSTHSVVSDEGHGTIKGGERDLFLARLAEWAATQDGAVICISDPYFAPDDIEFLRVLSQEAPTSSFRIATSRQQMGKKRISSPEEMFLDAWQERFDIEPPQTEFAIVGYGREGKHPIHDRWVVTKHSGIRLGSSINSIGLTRISDVSEMS